MLIIILLLASLIIFFYLILKELRLIRIHNEMPVKAKEDFDTRIFDLSKKIQEKRYLIKTAHVLSDDSIELEDNKKKMEFELKTLIEESKLVLKEKKKYFVSITNHL